MSDRIDRAVAEATREVAEIVGAQYQRRRFTITKFGRHPDGYLHARVVLDGKAAYFTRRFGSWLAPGHVGGQAVMKEPEALLGSELGREVKFTLSDKSKPFDNAVRREREREAERAKQRSTRKTEVAGGDDAPVADAGVPTDGDRGDASTAVPDDHE